MQFLDTHRGVEKRKQSDINNPSDVPTTSKDPLSNGKIRFKKTKKEDDSESIRNNHLNNESKKLTGLSLKKQKHRDAIKRQDKDVKKIKNKKLLSFNDEDEEK